MHLGHYSFLLCQCVLQCFDDDIATFWQENERLDEEVKRTSLVRSQQAAELKRLRQLERSVMFGEPSPSQDLTSMSLPLNPGRSVRANRSSTGSISGSARDLTNGNSIRRTISDSLSQPLLAIREDEVPVSPPRVGSPPTLETNYEPFLIGEVSQGGNGRSSRTRRQKKPEAHGHYSELDDGNDAAKKSCCTVS